MPIMETLRKITVTICYISLCVFTEQINEIPIIIRWLPIILFSCFKTSFSLRDLLMSLLGLSGLIFSLYASRAKEENSDVIGLIRATEMVHLLMCLDIILKYLLKFYLKMKYVFNKEVYRKLFCICAFTIALIVCFVWLFCCGIDFVVKMINSQPFNTINNFLTIEGNLNASVFYRGEDYPRSTLASTEKIFLVDKHRSSFVYFNYFFYQNTHSQLIKAYPGEDAKLTCSSRILLPGQLSASSLTIRFMKDKMEVKNSTRRTIHLPQKTLADGSYQTYSVTLFDIQPGDFGNYRIVLRTILRYGIPFSACSITMHRLVNVMEINLCVFNVSRIVDYYEFVDVPVGARLHFHKYYHRRISESEYLRVEHFINDIPLNMMSNITSECCLPSVHFYNNIWYKCPLRVPVIVLDKSYDINEYRFSEVKATLCACSSIYGIHRFKFYNEIYDTKQNMQITSEFWHPQVTVLYPKPSNIIWNYISEGVATLINKSKIEKSFSIFEGSAFTILQDNIDNDLTLKRLIESWVIVIIFSAFLIVAVLSLKYLFTLLFKFRNYAYQVMGLRVRLNPPNFGRNLACLLQTRDARYLACQNYRYDVFVLYVDDDRTFVIKELLPIFWEKQLSFFLSEEHVPPNRFKLEELQLALSQSDKIIVLVSDNFLIDEIYNSIFLPYIVLFRLMEGMIHSGHLMFLICKPCRFPEHLISNDKIVIMDFTNNQREIFFRKFNEWLESQFIPPGFGEQPVLHPDLLQLTHI